MVHTKREGTPKGTTTGAIPQTASEKASARVQPTVEDVNQGDSAVPQSSHVMQLAPSDDFARTNLMGCVCVCVVGGWGGGTGSYEKFRQSNGDSLNGPMSPKGGPANIFHTRTFISTVFWVAGNADGTYPPKGQGIPSAPNERRTN